MGEDLIQGAVRALSGAADPERSWDTEAVKSALHRLRGTALARGACEAIAAACDVRPSRWLRHDDLAEETASLLIRAGWEKVPRFLVLTSETRYLGESGGSSFFAEDEDNALMHRRRDLEAACLARAVEAMRAEEKPGRSAVLREVMADAGMELPRAQAGDSRDYMTARILDRLAERAPEHFAWLAEAIGGEPADGPFGWLVEGLARRARLRRSEAVERLTSLHDARAWEALAEEARAYVSAHPDDPEGYVFWVTAHRWEDELEEAEQVAREGLRRCPRALAILDAALTPMLLAGRGAAVLELWEGLRPDAIPGVEDPAAQDHARAEQHLAELSSPRERTILANVVGNVLVAYVQAGRVEEGLRAHAPYIERLAFPLLLGNAACLFALAGDVDGALRATARALAAGKPVEFFEDDADFDALRELPAFQALLEKARDHADELDEEEPDDEDEASDRAEAVPGILAQLESGRLAEIRDGLRALRAWVAEEGSEVDLSPFGVPTSDETLVESPLFDGILARYGPELGQEALLDLIGSLFNCNVEYHSTEASIVAARLVLRLGDAHAHHALVDLFQEACTYYDDGHRYHGESGMDLFIDEIFPACHASALARLLCWAYEDGYTQDLGSLLPALLRAGPSSEDETRVLEGYSGSLRGGDGALHSHGLASELSRIGECLEVSNLSERARGRLEALRDEVSEALREEAAIRAGLQRGSCSDLEALLDATGTTLPALRVERESTAIVAELCRHHPRTSGDALVRALPRLLGCAELFPCVLRLAVDLEPETTRRVLDELLTGPATREAAAKGLEDANRADLFASARLALRRRDIWTEALPIDPHPMLVEVEARLDARPSRGMRTRS